MFDNAVASEIMLFLTSATRYCSRKALSLQPSNKNINATNMDKLSYALGMNVGYSYLASGIHNLQVEDFA